MRLSIGVVLGMVLAVPLAAQIGPGGNGVARRIIRGAGAPSSGACTALGQVGIVYVQMDAASASSPLSICANTGVGTYGWVASGGSGSGFSPGGTQANGKLLIATSGSAYGWLATANSSILVTNSSGVPAWSTSLPPGLAGTTFGGSSTVTMGGSITVIAATHNQGINPVVQVYNTGGSCTSSSCSVSVNWSCLTAASAVIPCSDPTSNGTVVIGPFGSAGTYGYVISGSGAGATGPAGATGATGATGPAGTNGTNGAISTIYNSGSALPVQPFLNFVSGGCVNNAGATRTDCTTGGTTVTSLPPYIQLGSTLYISDDHMYAPTLPSFSGWATLTNSTGTRTTAIQTNGNYTYKNTGSFDFFGQTATLASMEVVEQIVDNGGSGQSPELGPYLYDSTNSKVDTCSAISFSSTGVEVRGLSFTYNGSGAPSSGTVIAANFIGGGIFHLKLSVSAGTATCSASLDGGISYFNIWAVSVGTIANMGVFSQEENGNIYSLKGL
jgi:hypothetical protein